MSGEFPLPYGWEAKVDAKTGAQYYVDHANQKTQWTDPRLTHPTIWRVGQLQILDKLKLSFPDAPEQTIRQILLRTHFDPRNASVILTNAGYHETTMRSSSPQPVASRTTSPQPMASRTTSPQPAASRSTSPRPQERSRAATTTEDVKIMQLRNRFPNLDLDNATFADILANCNNNVDYAADILSKKLTVQATDNSSSYFKKVTRNVRPETEAEERRRAANEVELKEQQRAAAADVADLKRRAIYLLTVEYGQLDKTVIEMAVDSTAGNVENARALLKDLAKDKAASTVSTCNKGDVPVTVNDVVESSVPAYSKDISSSSTITVTSVEVPTTGAESLPVQVIIERDVTVTGHKQRKSKKSPTKDAIRTQAPEKTVAAVGGNVDVGKTRTTIAKGPDPTLRRFGSSIASGPCSSLRRGPDDSLRRGANPELLESISFKSLPVSAVAGQ